jgi:RNA polymerase sigma-70 factor, ECF subfamily
MKKANKMEEDGVRTLELIVRMYQTRMVSFAFYHTRNRAEAEDYVQTSFLQMAMHMDTVMKMNQFQIESYLYHTIKRSIINASLTGETKHYGGCLEDIMEELPDRNTIPPEKQIVIQEEMDEIKRAIYKLDHYCREVMLLRMQEYSLEEISQVLGKPLNSVRAQLRRGKKLLNEMLREN